MAVEEYLLFLQEEKDGDIRNDFIITGGLLPRVGDEIRLYCKGEDKNYYVERVVHPLNTLGPGVRKATETDNMAPQARDIVPASDTIPFVFATRRK